MDGSGQLSSGMMMTDIRTQRLTRKERDLLTFLRQNAGKCVPRDVLLKQVWGYRDGVKSRTLDVHVQRLRKKLGPQEGSRILTVFRGGYLWSGNGSIELSRVNGANGNTIDHLVAEAVSQV